MANNQKRYIKVECERAVVHLEGGAEILKALKDLSKHNHLDPGLWAVVSGVGKIKVNNSEAELLSLSGTVHCVKNDEPDEIILYAIYKEGNNIKGGELDKSFEAVDVVITLLKTYVKKKEENGKLVIEGAKRF